MVGFDPVELLQSYGYIALLAGAFLEGELIVILAGVLAHQGYLSPYLAALSAFCGSVTSDQLMFFLGRWKGNAILHRFPRLEKRAPRVRALLARYETPLILGFRFIYGVRNVTPILMGMGAVSHVKFLLLNIVSAAVWACAFITLGYFFGLAVTTLLAAHPHADKVLLLAAALAVGGVWLWRRAGNRKKNRDNGDGS